MLVFLSSSITTLKSVLDFNEYVRLLIWNMCVYNIYSGLSLLLLHRLLQLNKKGESVFVV